MFDAYARELTGAVVPEAHTDPPLEEGEDGPDVEQIEQRYGPRIRREIDGR